MNTPAENRAALDRAKGKQPDALRIPNGFYMGPSHKSPAAIPRNAQALRTIR